MLLCRLITNRISYRFVTYLTTVTYQFVTTLTTYLSQPYLFISFYFFINKQYICHNSLLICHNLIYLFYFFINKQYICHNSLLICHNLIYLFISFYFFINKQYICHNSLLICHNLIYLFILLVHPHAVHNKVIVVNIRQKIGVDRAWQEDAYANPLAPDFPQHLPTMDQYGQSLTLRIAHLKRLRLGVERREVVGLVELRTRLSVAKVLI